MGKEQIGYIIHESSMETDTKIISENNKRVVAEAVMQDGDEVNRNGRCYRTKDLRREINCARTQELVAAKEMKGECGHPTDNAIIRQQTILPTLTCFRMNKLWMDGNLVKAHVQGTNNALGEEFDTDLREGGKKAFSLRALGTIITENGRNYVDNLRIITYDYVIYPSHVKAYTSKIITESAAIDSGNKMVYESTDSGILIPITNDSVMSYVKSESANLSKVFTTFDTIFESMSVINGGKDVQLIAKNGDMIVVRLENYIQNEIMDYCIKH